MKLILGLLVFAFISVLTINNVYAVGIRTSPAVNSPQLNEDLSHVNITITDLVPSNEYEICMRSYCEGAQWISIDSAHNRLTVWAADDNLIECSQDNWDSKWFQGGKDYRIQVRDKTTGQNYELGIHMNYYYPPYKDLSQNDDGTLRLAIGGCRHNNTDGRNDYNLFLDGLEGTPDPNDPAMLQVTSNHCLGSQTFGPLNDGKYLLHIDDRGENMTYYTWGLEIKNGNLILGDLTKDPGDADPGVGEDGGTGTEGVNPCGQPGGQCDTAIGLISSNGTEFIGKVLEISLGIAGAIALIFMVIGSIRVLTSSGDQQRLNGGREMIIAAVAGLLFIVFSILILQFIDAKLITIGFQ